VSSAPVIVAILAALPGCATTPPPPKAPPDPIVWRTTRCTEAPAQWQASCHSVHQRMGIADDTASPLLFPGPAGDARNATAAEAVDRLLASTLKDPLSAIQYQVSDIVSCYAVVADGIAAATREGCVCYAINARNSYGGYTGVEPGVAILIGDGAVYFADTAPRSSLLPTAAATCVMTAHMHARDASRIHDAVRR
jgi:hypothetical protein